MLFGFYKRFPKILNTHFSYYVEAHFGGNMSSRRMYHCEAYLAVSGFPYDHQVSIANVLLYYKPYKAAVGTYII